MVSNSQRAKNVRFSSKSDEEYDSIIGNSGETPDRKSRNIQRRSPQSKINRNATMDASKKKALKKRKRVYVSEHTAPKIAKNSGSNSKRGIRGDTARLANAGSHSDILGSRYGTSELRQVREAEKVRNDHGSDNYFAFLEKRKLESEEKGRIKRNQLHERKNLAEFDSQIKKTKRSAGSIQRSGRDRQSDYLSEEAAEN